MGLAAFFQHQNISSGLRLGSGTWKTSGNEVLLGSSWWDAVAAPGVCGWVHKGFHKSTVSFGLLNPQR